MGRGDGVDGLALPPATRGHFLLGHLPELARDPLGLLTTWGRDYPEHVPLSFGPVRGLMLTQPEEIERVLLGDQRDFAKSHALRQDRQVFGRGLLTSDGELWRRQHRLLLPAFRRDRLPGYADQAVARTDAGLAEWRSGEVRDLHGEMLCLMAQVAVRTLFGANLAWPEAAAIVRAVTDSFAAAMDGAGTLTALLFGWLPVGRGRRFQRAFGEVEDFVQGLIARRRRADPGPAGDALGLLLDGPGAGSIGEKQVRDEVMTLLVAGSETTANAIAWTGYLLATHPAVAAAVQAEVDAQLGGRPPSAAALPHLSLMQRVLAESLRLYPPAHTLLRTTTRASAVGGYRVPAGMIVVLSPWVVHRDRRHFEEPDAFRPERWLPGTADRIPRGAYFPFSRGPRTCIAMAYAQTVALAILARLTQRFELTLASDSQVVPHAAALLRPSPGVPVLVQRR